MSIHRSIDAGKVTVTFALPHDDSGAPASVVGSFNDWTPGVHPFEASPDGSRSVTIVVPIETDLYFRYLGVDGQWFDDPEADEITSEGSILRAPTQEAVPEPDRTDGGPTPDEERPAVPDETGERLETVANLINEAQNASHDLADRDLLIVDTDDRVAEK